MFIAFHLSISFVVNVDPRSDMCGTPPWIWSACYSLRISQMFWKIAVWTQSATDDPGFCFLLSSHGTSDSPPMKGFNCRLVYSEYIKGS